MNGDEPTLYDPIGLGIAAGILRCNQAGLAADHDMVSEAEGHLRELIPEVGEPRPPVLNLVAEIVVVASAARAMNDEAPLEPSQLRDYVDATAKIVNSFWHPPWI
jgi:hypothetical protein